MIFEKVSSDSDYHKIKSERPSCHFPCDPTTQRKLQQQAQLSASSETLSAQIDTAPKTTRMGRGASYSQSSSVSVYM